MIVVRALDVAAALRDASGILTVVSGFQSPVERECLNFLLRGTVQLVMCPARSAIGMRIPAAWKPAITAGRLTVRSAIDEGFEMNQSVTAPKRAPRAPRRPTAALAEHRNRFVASIADVVLILHATPGGKLDRLADEVIRAGKPLWTLDDAANAELIARGARRLRPERVAELWTSQDAPSSSGTHSSS